MTTNDGYHEGSEALRWELRLYVAGKTDRSLRAIANLEKICADYLESDYHIRVIDLYENPQLAMDEQILGTPTLIRRLPLPMRRVIGDLSKTDKVLVGLDIVPSPLHGIPPAPSVRDCHPGHRREAISRLLTTRQIEILCLVAQGRTSGEIAEILEISPRTVDNHRARIMESLGVKNIAELTRMAIQAGLISI